MLFETENRQEISQVDTKFVKTQAKIAFCMLCAQARFHKL